jgi:hypothetical protein
VGALGAWATLLAEPLLHRTLVLGAPASGGGSAAVWAVLTAPSIAVVGIWAVAAAILPFLVRGRLLVLDVVAAAGWAAGLAAATQAALGTAPRGLIQGAIVAAALAILPRAQLRTRDAR